MDAKLEVISVDSLVEREMHPRVKEQVRDIKLRKLADKQQTQCDECKRPFKRSNCLEIWSGNRLIYVICQMCIRSGEVRLSWRPDGFIIEHDDNKSTVGDLVGLMSPSIRPSFGK